MWWRFVCQQGSLAIFSLEEFSERILLDVNLNLILRLAEFEGLFNVWIGSTVGVTQ